MNQIWTKIFHKIIEINKLTLDEMYKKFKIIPRGVNILPGSVKNKID